MKNAIVISITALVLTAISCTKVIEEPAITEPGIKYTPTIPDGDRIFIHFGTSTKRGCLYSFSNCIWIGWDEEDYNAQNRLALQFGNGSAAGQYFGQYFPLTSDYTIDPVTAQDLGLDEGVIPAGFYPLRKASDGTLRVVFEPAEGFPAGNLYNLFNPQDKVGQLHNLAVQVILNENQNEIQALKNDEKALQKFLTDKAAQFLAEVELPVSGEELKGAQALNFNRDFSDYKARLAESNLSQRDRELLLPVFDQAVAMTVNTPEDLGQFVNFMNDQEYKLTRYGKMDNPKVVLSMLSILKNSRYFWYWKSISAPNEDGTVSPERIPVWLADAIGAEFGGLIGAIVASALASEK